MIRRYEVIATMTLPDVGTWVVPASEGKHYRRGLLSTLRTVRRWNRNAAADPSRWLPPLVWTYRRAA